MFHAEDPWFKPYLGQQKKEKHVHDVQVRNAPHKSPNQSRPNLVLDTSTWDSACFATLMLAIMTGEADTSRCTPVHVARL